MRCAPRPIAALPLSLWLCALVAGCGPDPQRAPVRSGQHGVLSELSRVDGVALLCEHRVPEQVCVRHHPELIPFFKRVNDWCPPHGVPESQCFKCHPDLSFEPLPELPPEADVAWLTKTGEDVGPLETHAVRGKVTVFEFAAAWCAACRKVDGHVYERLAKKEPLAFRKLDVVDWDSPLAQRWLLEVPQLPYVVVFAPDGRKVGAISGADLAAIDAAIAEASTPR
jgi:thiol-disulfide isomerase/thioredoxin